MSKVVDIIIRKEQPKSISVTCSCLKCDSITCFAKRRLCEPCTCGNCNQSKSCRYYICQNELRKRHSDQITAVYLNAAKPKPKSNNEFEELTEHDINYESERQKILETNQPPPHSLNEYLDRLLSVTKVSSKFKYKPSSLSGYIEMISENSEYKKKMNLLKGYVQSLKEAKPSYHSEDLSNFESFTNSISPKPYRYQVSEKHRVKCKSKCKGKCKSRQKSKNLDITQAQSATLSYPQNIHSPERMRFGSQTNNVIYENSNCSGSCRTTELSASKETSFFNYDILKRLKEAYKVCSCKVCECIPSKLTKDDICKCKPCECAECTCSTVPQITSSVYKPDLNCNCYRFNDQIELQPLKEQKECFCEPCECAQCLKNSLEVPCEQCKELVAYQSAEVRSNRYTACTCLPCDCIECEHRNAAGRVFSERQLYHFNHQTASVNEIYHRGNTGKKNKQNIVTMYAGIPPLNTNVGFDNTYSKSCFCKECECLKCVCKEDTINSIKSSRLFSHDEHVEKTNSIIEKSAILMKPNYNHNYTPTPYKIKRDRIPQSTSNHAPCCTCDECIRLEKETPLNRCNCAACRCERCYGHATVPNYSNIASASLIKKGDVLTASAHQTKVQNQNLVKDSASINREYKSLCTNLNSNHKSQCEGLDYHSISKNMYPEGLARQSSVIHQVKKDNGTMCTKSLNKSLNKWSILQCDAYVQSQKWNISKPLLKNNCTNITPGSYTSINSINESPSIENEVVQLPKPVIGCLECDPKIDLKLNTDVSIPVLKKTLSVKQNDFNNILTKIPSAHDAEECKTCLNSLQETTESNDIGRNIISNCSSKNKSNVHSNTNIETKIDIISDSNYESIKLPLESPKVLQAKCLSDPALTSPETFIINNSEEIPKEKSSKSSNNNGDNFKCFHMTEKLNQYNPNGYVYTHNKLPKANSPDRTTNNLLDTDDDYRRVRKTLADAKQFSLHLLSLLKMYEKANKEFEKVSEKLKISYEAVFGDKISQRQDKCDTTLENICGNLHSNTNLYLKETATPDYKQTLFENIVTKRSDDCRRISQKQEFTNLSKAVSESSYKGYGILEKVSVGNKRQNVFNAHKNLGRVCHDSVHNKQSNEKSKYITTPDYESTFPTHEDETVPEIIHDNLKQVKEYSKPLGNIELLPRSSNTTSIDIPDKDTHGTSATKEIKTKMLTVYQNSIGCTAKPNSMDQSEGVNGFPSLEVGMSSFEVGMSPLEVQKSSANTIKNEVSYHENKALNQLHLEVKKLLELTILEPLNYVEDAADSLVQSPSILKPQSVLNVVVNVKTDEEPTKQIDEPSACINEEACCECDDQDIMSEFKKQIREELQVACAHPLLNKGSSLGSYSSNGDCDDQKARFLVVRKVSEHTALVRWSEPRELLGVKGYELLVDGRTIQKIFNPSKCISAVTCLPHTEKILLTIRTITSVMPDAGHYPSTTIVYRPRLQ